MRIGIIGCGAIAREIIARRKDVVAVYDKIPEKCSDINVKKCESLSSLLDSADFIIEAASPGAVKDYALEIIRRKKDMLIMSVGGLAEREFRERIFREAKEKGVKLYIPSGAIGGIDLIRSAKIAGIKRAKIISTKNAKTLGVDVDERKMIFRGSAEEAIKRFPKSTNVTVLLLIATGVDVEVQVYADPDIAENRHEVEIEGEFGRAKIVVENKPSKMNPKTSYLAALSPISLLDFIESSIVVGV